MDVDLMLKKYGVKYEDLNTTERETFNMQVTALREGQLSLDKLKDAITRMREACILEVSHYDTGSKQDLFVKARIRNYTLILSLFQSAEVARKTLEESLSRVK